MYQNQYSNDYTYEIPVSRVSAIMKRVYATMTLGLLVTAVLSWYCGNSIDYLTYFVNNSWMMWGLIIAEFGIVIGVSAAINRLNTFVAGALFLIFAAINGLLLAPIFVVYTTASIAKTFLITAVTFAAMSIYGFCTDRDLSRIGNFLFMALIGLIIASLVNMFMRSTTMEYIISFVGVLIFTGLTAWDTQQIKNMAMTMPAAGVGRLAVLGALNLYLDFINLFLYLLRFFGSSRD